jgi:hypothetical protein
MAQARCNWSAILSRALKNEFRRTKKRGRKFSNRFLITIESGQQSRQQLLSLTLVNRAIVYCATFYTSIDIELQIKADHLNNKLRNSDVNGKSTTSLYPLQFATSHPSRGLISDDIGGPSHSQSSLLKNCRNGPSN